MPALGFCFSKEPTFFLTPWLHRRMSGKGDANFQCFSMVLVVGHKNNSETDQ